MTPFGEIKTREGNMVGWDASISGQHISLAGSNDSIVSFTVQEAEKLYFALGAALHHCGVDEDIVTYR